MKQSSLLATTIIGLACLVGTGCKKTPKGTVQEIDATISYNTTWSHSDGLSEDIIVNGTVSVEAGLTIMPGTVIHFRPNSALVVRNGGYLNAVGTKDKKITFAGMGSLYQGLVFYSTSIQNQLQYCVISGGGQGSAIFQPAAVMIGEYFYSDGIASIRDCFFDGSVGNGIYVVETSSLNDFHGNSFTNNTGFPVSVSAENLNQLNADNTFSANGRNYVEIRDCVYPKGASQTWKKLPVPYYLGKLVNLFGANTVEAGATIVSGTEGTIHPAVSGAMVGSFTAIGSVTDMITFKGESNTPGAWNGIFISTTSSKNELRYCHISYGGGATNPWGQNGMVSLDENSGGAVSIRDCFIDNSSGFGMHLGGNPTFNADIATANTFASNAKGNIQY